MNNDSSQDDAIGIKNPNCLTCAHLSNESDGGESELAITWPVCGKFKRYQYLKTFPFKTKQPCFEPNFWFSKFTDMIDGSDESVTRALDAFNQAKSSTSTSQLLSNK